MVPAALVAQGGKEFAYNAGRPGINPWHRKVLEKNGYSPSIPCLRSWSGLQSMGSQRVGGD